MARSRVSCRSIFPPICLVAAGCHACSSDSDSPRIGSGGQAPVAGSTASAASAGAAPLGGGTQGGGTSTAAGTGGASGSATAGATSEAGSASGGSAGAGGSDAQGGGGGSAGRGGSGGGIDDLPPLEPCEKPSVSHLKVWEMQVVGGSQVPANGSPLRKYDGGYEMYVEWTLNGGEAYGTANTPLNNMGQYANGADPLKNVVDLSKGDGITLEYSSTGSTYLQLRTAAVPHGGDHFKADLPATNGQMQTVKLLYADFRRPGGNTPPGNDILSGMFSLTFVGSATTKLTLRQIRTPGFIPPCN